MVGQYINCCHPFTFVKQVVSAYLTINPVSLQKIISFLLRYAKMLCSSRNYWNMMIQGLKASLFLFFPKLLCTIPFCVIFSVFMCLDLALFQTGVSSHMDDEYKWAGVEDPKVMVTTSRDPSSRLKMFAKVSVQLTYCLYSQLGAYF